MKIFISAISFFRVKIFGQNFLVKNLLKIVLGTYLSSLVKIGSVTAEILLTLSLVVGGGGGGGWCKVIFS